MSALVIDGKRVDVPALADTVTWLDSPKVPKATDGRRRARSAVKAVVVHTTKAHPVKVRPGSLASTKAEALARYQASTTRDVSWHFTVDFDGTVVQSADPATWTCWHAGHVNGWTVGIEMVQGDDGSLYEHQLAVTAALVAWLCDVFGIERRYPVGADGRPASKPIAALGGKGTAPWSGVFGHRNQTSNKPAGDPGDPIFDRLAALGFTGYRFDAPTARPATAPAPRIEPATIADLPAWLDPAAEITDTADRVEAPARFAARHFAVLRQLGLDVDRAAELVAHAATECDHGRREIGHNAGGVKAKQVDASAHERKLGDPMPWWRWAGHVDSGDAPVVYYRGFADEADFWSFALKRYVPRAPQGERYDATGAAFWSAAPETWFVELLRAGYRGPVREEEIAALGARADTHPSVVAHRDVVRRVRAMVGL